MKNVFVYKDTAEEIISSFNRPTFATVTNVDVENNTVTYDIDFLVKRHGQFVMDLESRGVTLTHVATPEEFAYLFRFDTLGEYEEARRRIAESAFAA